MLCFCLQLARLTQPFTLYRAVRLVLPCCSGARNVFVASKADNLISFSKV
jgi:hypothetical protein